MAIVTGATGGGVQAPGRMQMPSVDYSLVATNDALSNISAGRKIGKDIIEYKKNRENELKQKAADIALTEATASKAATDAKTAAETADAQIKEINTKAALGQETDSQVLNGLVANREKNLQIFNDSTDVLAKVAAAKKEVGEQIAETEKVNAQINLGERQNRLSALPAEAAQQKAQSEVMTDVLTQMKQNGGKPVTVDLGGGRQGVYSWGPKGLGFDVLTPVPTNKQSYISTRSVQRPGAAKGVEDVYGTTPEGIEVLIPSLSAKPGAAGATGVAGDGPTLVRGGYFEQVDPQIANEAGVPVQRPNEYRNMSQKTIQSEMLKQNEADRKFQAKVDAAADGSDKLNSLAQAFRGKMEVESTSEIGGALTPKWLRGTDEREMRTISQSMGALLNDMKGQGAITENERTLMLAQLPSPDHGDSFNRQALDIIEGVGVTRLNDYSRFRTNYKGVWGNLKGAQEAWDEYKKEVPIIVGYDAIKKSYAADTGLTGKELEAAWSAEEKAKGYEKDRVYRNPNYVTPEDYFRTKNATTKDSDGAEQQSAGAPAEYKSADDVKAAFQRGEISREEAKKILTDMGGVP